MTCVGNFLKNFLNRAIIWRWSFKIHVLKHKIILVLTRRVIIELWLLRRTKVMILLLKFRTVTFHGCLIMELSLKTPSLNYYNKECKKCSVNFLNFYFCFRVDMCYLFWLDLIQNIYYIFFIHLGINLSMLKEILL